MMIDTLRRAVEEKTMVRYKKQSCDLFTASAVVLVYDALNETNKEKYGHLIETNLGRAARIAFKFVK